MNFLDQPHCFTRTPRLSRDVCREAIAIEQFAPRTRRADGHRWVSLACLLAGLVVIVIIASEKFA